MSLLRTAAKASIATRVAGNVHRRQQNRWAVEDAARAAAAAPPAPQVVHAQPAPQVVQAPPPPAPQPVAAPAQADPLEQLRQLGELRSAGLLSEAEFEAAKAPIIARMAGN